MKKLALFLAVLFTTIACTKDDSSQNQDTSILPKKIISADSSGTLEFSINYDGNKIKEILSVNGLKTVYTYTNDLITNTTTYKEKLISSTNDFVYENGRIKSNLFTYYSIDPNKSTPVHKSRINYSTNADGTILEETYSIDLITGVETKTEDYTTYIYTNGNLTKSTSIKSYTNFNGSSSVTTIYKSTNIYEYDKYKNPLINILGFSKTGYGQQGSLNNVIKDTYTTENSTDGVKNTSTSTPAIRNYILTYNANNFLTESKITDNNKEKSSTQYFYE